MNEMREPERGIRLTNERERVARAQDSLEKRRIERNEGSGKGASVASRAIKVDACRAQRTTTRKSETRAAFVFESITRAGDFVRVF